MAGPVTREGLVSVVIPAYNAERYVGEAIASVLAQDHEPRGGDRRETTARPTGRARSWRASRGCDAFAQENAGIGPARNTGVAVAEGEFLAFLDADDLWMPGGSPGRSRPSADPALDMVFGHAEQFASPERAEEIERTVSFVKGATPAYFAGTMLIRRAAFDRAGPFPSEFDVGEFVEWYLRAIDLGLTSARHPRLVLRRRIHDSNTGRRMRDSRMDYVRIVKASLDRRRAAGGPRRAHS